MNLQSDRPDPLRLNLLDKSVREAVLGWWNECVQGSEDVTIRSFVRTVSKRLAERQVWVTDSCVRDLWNLIYPERAEHRTVGIDA